MKAVIFALFVLLCLWQQAAAFYCQTDYYDCGDGYCVPDDDVCNGVDNCYNGADEAGCSCPTDYYDCGDGTCTPDDNVCNGVQNCYNGADEAGCYSTSVNVPLAAGLAIAGFVLFIVLPLIIIPVICCCCLGACASAATGTRRTRVVTHTAPSSGPQVTVVNSNSANMMQSGPPAYTPSQHAYQPVPGYRV